MFLDSAFINELYSVILRYFRKARNNAIIFNSLPLMEFIDSQIEYAIEARKYLRATKVSFRGQLEKLLLKLEPSLRPG